MLTNALLQILATVLNTVISVLPTGGSLPTEIDASLNFVADRIAGWATIFPFVATLVTVVGLILTIEAFIFAYGGVNWTINKVRGSG